MKNENKDLTYYPNFHFANQFKIFVNRANGRIMSKLKIWSQYHRNEEQLRLLTADDHELWKQQYKPGCDEKGIRNFEVFDNYLKENQNN